MEAIRPDIEHLETWLASSLSREHTNQYDDLKLDPVARLVAHLNPIPRPVTIAGTKGKGSTQAFLEQLLLAHGENTIVFTSPHIVSICERWRLNGSSISIDNVVQHANHIAQIEQELGIQLTYFERCFGIACSLAKARPDAHFLCEVGLGGRLDCANSLDTRLAICTHLSLDHMHVLGDTLEAIAGEKLAIARPDAALIIAQQSAAGAAAIQSKRPQARSYPDLKPIPSDATLGIAGDHQLENARTALTALYQLYPDPKHDAIIASLAATSLPARSHILNYQGHRYFIDGAHNDASIAATLETAIAQLGPDLHIILGLATDKDWSAILPLLQNHHVSLVGYEGPRARRRQDWPDAPSHWTYYETIIKALEALPPQPSLICGSFYLAGEALAILSKD